MATMTRQPFAPLQHSRLQMLKSMKNTYNAPVTSPLKRKADTLDVSVDNLDPIKRSKFSMANFSKETFKPAIRCSVLAPSFCNTQSVKASTPRRVANTSDARKPVSVPSSTSAARTRRSGANRALPYSSSTKSRLGRASSPPFFALNMAVKSTFGGRGKTSKVSMPRSSSKSLLDLDVSAFKPNWNFDIHEDTMDQELTNMIEHGTCILDLSSDEDCEKKARQELADGRNKENIPPADYVSAILTRSTRRRTNTKMTDRERRVVLAEMAIADFYSEDCDESSTFIVPADEPLSDAKGSGKGSAKTPKVALELVTGTGDNFDLWESGSAKDENEA